MAPVCKFCIYCIFILPSCILQYHSMHYMFIIFNIFFLVLSLFLDGETFFISFKYFIPLFRIEMKNHHKSIHSLYTTQVRNTTKAQMPTSRIHIAVELKIKYSHYLLCIVGEIKINKKPYRTSVIWMVGGRIFFFLVRG